MLSPSLKECGSLDCIFLEFTSICTGARLYLLEQWRAERAAKGEIDTERAVDYESWKIEWAKGSAAQLRILQMLDSHAILVQVRTAMRGGSVPILETALLHCIEHAAATGGDKYVPILTNVVLLLKTCSDRTLACLPKLLFIDMGSMYIGVDLCIEYFNLHLALQVPVFRNAEQYKLAMALAARGMRDHPRSGRLGCVAASRDNTRGLADLPIDPTIARTAYDVLVHSKLGRVDGYVQLLPLHDNEEKNE